MNTNRPNILVILSDQQHYRAMSCAGEQGFNTPALDALAAAGAMFDLTYCANPVCVPSRYSLLSGHMPHVFGGKECNDKKNRYEQPMLADWLSTPALGTIFSKAGYDTFYGGKLHMHGFASFTPEAEGQFGFRCLSEDQSDELVRACVRFFLERRENDRPFLLCASFIQPHNICAFRKRHKEATGLPTESGNLPNLPSNFEPTIDEPEWMTLFREGELRSEEEFELGLNRTYGRLCRTWSDDEWRRYRAAYRHCVEELDRQVGIVMDGLRESSLLENTVVVFTSDHGDHDGAHRLAMKRSFYDESARVPLIISHAGLAKNKHVNATDLVNNGVDLIPTLCDFADIAVPDGLPGRSLKPLVHGEAVSSWRKHVVSETVGGRMLRSARFKYCVFFGTKAEEMLLDMKDDPGETRNLATDPHCEEVLRDHRQQLREWVEENRDEKGRRYLDQLP